MEVDICTYVGTGKRLFDPSFLDKIIRFYTKYDSLVVSTFKAGILFLQDVKVKIIILRKFRENTSNLKRL